MSKKTRKSQTKPKRYQRKGEWQTIFDAKPMAEGMPPSFLLKLLNQQPVFVRHGKLLTALIWLQSQMIGAICLHESSDLRRRCKKDNGKHLPTALGQATIVKLENLSSESLRKEFRRCFQSSMSTQLQDDLATVPFYRDALSHGYISLRQLIIGPEPESIFWSPRSSSTRNKMLESLYGPRPDNTFLRLSLSELAFQEEIDRICRLMDFIALILKDWEIPYPVFA